METIINKLKLIFSDKSLRNRVLFVLGAFLVFRLLSSIPVPGIDSIRLANFIENNQFMGILSMFSGVDYQHSHS